jgi:hypothetical protein
MTSPPASIILGVTSISSVGFVAGLSRPESTSGVWYVKGIVPKEIQGKPSVFLGLSLRGLGPIWLN